ncbi:MAG: FxDxF family PEP-CTERM protein [Patescibacteria group bacterium]
MTKKLVGLLLGLMMFGLPIATNAQYSLSGVGSFNQLATRCVTDCLGDPGLTLVSGATGWMEVGNETYSFANFNPTTGIVFGVNQAFSGLIDLFGWYNSAPVASASVDNGVFLPFSGIMPTSAEAFASANTVMTPIPEPETYAMLLAGLGVLGFYARRRRVFSSADAA